MSRFLITALLALFHGQGPASTARPSSTADVTIVEGQIRHAFHALDVEMLYLSCMRLAASCYGLSPTHIPAGARLTKKHAEQSQVQLQL